MVRHLESTFPDEGCGVILRGPEGWRVRPMENVSPTPRYAYRCAPRELLQVFTEQEARGEQLVCVFHSHVEVGAWFSAEDRAQAAPDGVPLWPGVTWLVVAIEGGQASSARLFCWKDGDFVGREVPLGSRVSAPRPV